MSAWTPMPKLSIVIPCFNAMPFIEETLSSIVGLPEDDVEILIQDGGSTDGTLEVIQKFGSRINVCSEKDHGQTDALNRAIERSSGEFIGWLNADDLYYPDTLPNVIRAFAENPQADIVFGDFNLIDAQGNVLRKYQVSPWNWERIMSRGCYVYTGATFFRRKVFDRYGLLDTRYHYAMDFEYFLRIGRGVEAVHISESLGAFRVYPESKSGSMPWEFAKETYRAGMHYANGNRRLQANVIRNILRKVVVSSLNSVRWSQGWSHFRKSKKL